MNHAERGEGKFGLIVMILLLAAVIFVLVKVVPPRINAYEFKDFMETYARTDCWNRTEDQMKKDLLEKAGALDLPVKPENIKIQREGANVKIEAAFDVPVDLKVHTLVLHYDFTQNAEHY
jgi:hypothetical protein